MDERAGLQADGHRCEVFALFRPATPLRPLLERLTKAGVGADAIEMLSSLPLPELPRPRPHRPSLYTITILGGLLGIVVGLFFAAGTAVLYPIVTGGKAIVAPPVVGIIAYETMMLLAIVLTFAAMAVRVVRTTHTTTAAIRDPRIHDGYLGITVRLTGKLGDRRLQDLLQDLGAIEVRIVETPCPRLRWTAATVLALSLLVGGCSQDMQEQASYQPQEGPRKHSPDGSVPRTSRAVVLESVGGTPDRLQHGAGIFAVNCRHCHGPQGDGDGPVAGYLIEQPANLHSARVQSKTAAQIYGVVTNGKEQRMPAFKGFLSAEERWAVAYYVKALSAER
jgi:hypothetical protein